MTLESKLPVFRLLSHKPQILTEATYMKLELVVMNTYVGARVRKKNRRRIFKYYCVNKFKYRQHFVHVDRAKRLTTKDIVIAMLTE